MQFNRSLEGQLTLLPKPAVDTGAGLERLASILQKTKTNYETDLFSSLIHSIAESLVTEITTESQISLRVIADHARATTFLMSDGVFPAPEGRGYVLRRIMRRAIRHGKKLGFQEPFLYRSVESVINLMQDTYPDLKEKRALIQKAVQAEEEQFFRTLEKGLVLLEQSYEQLPTGGTLSGEIAFKLYDTYGFPLDLTQLLSAEKGFRVDEVGFQKGMQKQRMESRKHWKGSGQQILNEYDLNLVDHLKQLNQLPQFLGYSQFEVVSQCVAWFSEESNQWQSMRVSTEESQSQHLKAIFLETPFYAESGGQLADQGKVLGQNFEAEVVDVQRPVPELIVLHLNILKGTLQVGEKYQQLIDLKKRTALSRHHTATHLLHWALRKVLGEHVKQAGSLVTHEILRFDFTHFQPLSSEQWIEIEDLMNEKIWSGASVEKQEMHKEQALQLGALAFFGEKYSDRVRVVQIGNFSKELCGGTHVEALTELHLVKIVQEVGIAAGVRRIIACSAQPAFQYLRGKDQDLKRIKDQLRVSSSEEILGKIKKMQTLEKDHQQQLEQWYSQHIKSLVQIWFEKVEWIQGVPCLFQCVREEGCNMKMLRDLADALKQKLPQGVIVLGAQENDRGLLLVACGAKVPSIIRAQDLIAVLAPFIEGKGGGKADLAQAGGSYIAGLSEALKQARDWLLRKLT